ncbi:MAG: hypothetical protein HYY30_11025 [Chloroflexi bacterium]|nr:hypothetical protein [Chloroflexota bacterium]
MLGSPLLAALALMALVSVLFYKINVQFLSGGQLAMMIWVAAGIPIFAVSFALMATLMQPPQSYGALAALAGLGNGMVGLGIRLIALRRRGR